MRATFTTQKERIVTAVDLTGERVSVEPPARCVPGVEYEVTIAPSGDGLVARIAQIGAGPAPRKSRSKKNGKTT